MVIVIADDITGGAEIAGIAHRYGLRTVMTIDRMPQDYDEGKEYDVVVIATDARSYRADVAAEITAEAVRSVCRKVTDLANGSHLFRKTDSALRGNVKEELDAIIHNSPYDYVRYMPANPSKGRIIADGVYYIRDDKKAGRTGTPISETSFRYDPEFPALSSSMEERFPGLPYANATTKEEVDNVVREALENEKRVLLAGAADLFCSMIERIYGFAPQQPREFEGLPEKCAMLVVCGSTLSRAIDLGLAVETMPYDVFYEEKEPKEWTENIAARYLREAERIEQPRHGTVMTIGDKPVRKGHEAAVFLRNAMAEVCCGLIRKATPDEMVIEGGATAFAILKRMPWHTFYVTDEVAPGVVRMAAEGGKMCVTLKPGSYEWGELWK